MLIDAKTHMLWLFFTTSKNPPLHILRWFFTNLRSDKCPLARIHVDEDGNFPGSTAFCKYIRDEEALNLETTGGYASYLNEKNECPDRTIAERVRGLLMNSSCPKKDWCYASEHSAYLYRVTLHSAIYMSPREA
jgi:hypothetical protein